MTHQYEEQQMQVTIPMQNLDGRRDDVQYVNRNQRRRAREFEESEWLTLFYQLDVDRDGRIPMIELRDRVQVAAASMGLTGEELREVVIYADKNRDDWIDFSEFALMIGFYIYYVVDLNAGISISGPVPIDSWAIYHPKKRYQVWRYLSYMLIHIGIYHIVFNVITQIVLGIPLELVHKFWRVGLVYIAGVIAGSLAVSVTDNSVYLAGASGGVYALIAAHVANLTVNWAEMEFAVCRLIFFVILIGADLGVALYNRYASPTAEKGNKVSYMAHIGGFVAGLLMGIVVLRNFKQKTWERVVWWIALIGYISLMLACIAWNIFYDGYPPSV